VLEELKIMLGDTATNYTDAQLALAVKMACAEVEEYCNRELDISLEFAALQIAQIKLNRLGTEGLASQAFSGVNESYVDGYPAQLQALLNRKRKIKVV
jgi:hypothetical protein